MTTHQILTSAGHYATCRPYFIATVGSGAGLPWICKDFAIAIESAAKNAMPASELARLAWLLRRAEFSEGPELLLPMTPAESEALESKLADFKCAVLANPRKFGIYTPSNYSSFQSELAAVCSERRFELSPKKLQNWIYLPRNFAFKDNPSKACMIEHDKAAAIVERCELLLLISELLNKATAQAKKLGASLHDNTLPARKLPAHVREMAQAHCKPFAAAEAYASRECFAVYLGPHGNARRRGFLTARGDSAPDLGSALLFPTQKLALAKASQFASAAVVTVDIAPKSYAPAGATNTADAFAELAAVIAAKEAAEIDAAIKGARIEELEAELAARQAQTPGGAAPSRGRL